MPLTLTRRIIMQKARRHTYSAPTACKRMVSGSIPPLPGFFPSFSRPTEFTIGRRVVFSLAGWSPLIRSRFHVTESTQVPLKSPLVFAYGAVTLYCQPFQTVLLTCGLVTLM